MSKVHAYFFDMTLLKTKRFEMTYHIFLVTPYAILSLKFFWFYSSLVKWFGTFCKYQNDRSAPLSGINQCLVCGRRPTVRGATLIYSGEVESIIAAISQHFGKESRVVQTPMLDAKPAHAPTQPRKFVLSVE